jgi:hypothetical protein
MYAKLVREATKFNEIQKFAKVFPSQNFENQCTLSHAKIRIFPNFGELVLNFAH